MALYLVAPGLDLSIELNISESVERAFAIQVERLRDSTARDQFCRRMSLQLDALIPDSIDWDIKEPTQAQVSFALALSKQHQVAIPPEALRHRAAMHEFLDRYGPKPKYKTSSKAP